MYLGVPTQPSCAMAWLAATQLVDAAPGHEAHNVIVDIADPTAESTVDDKIVFEVDTFLRTHEHWPVRTVANTIFPQAIYELHGAPAFYDVYLTKVFPRIKRSRGDWGRYFERMISFPKEKRDREPLNPLKDLVSKMRENLEHDRTFKNIYELTTFDPVRDAGRPMNRQCLSFLSFKLTDDRRLILTAMYRNHYYIQRLLGNLIGLGNLMSFVAKETGAKVGPLTVVSTHAEIDTVGTRKEMSAMLERCAAIQRLECFTCPAPLK
jgi:thymidylate synthase